jgi:hypothetical protein
VNLNEIMLRRIEEQAQRVQREPDADEPPPPPSAREREAARHREKRKRAKAKAAQTAGLAPAMEGAAG